MHRIPGEIVGDPEKFNAAGAGRREKVVTFGTRTLVARGISARVPLAITLNLFENCTCGQYPGAYAKPILTMKKLGFRE